MASTIGGTSKPKCKYWDKCFRKEKVHLQQFLHPADEEKDDEKSDQPQDPVVLGGTGGKGKTTAQRKNAKKQINLDGKRVIFIGNFGKYSVDQMSARAELFGCNIADELAEDVDIVICGKNPGMQESDAKYLGLRIVTAEYWDDLVSRSNLKQTAAKGNNKADTSDTEDDVPTASASKTAPKVTQKLKRQRTHNLSDSEGEGEEDGHKNKKQKTNVTDRVESDMDTSDENQAASKDDSKTDKTTTDKKKKGAGGDAAPAAAKVKGTKIAKCKYWDKCYRKDADHIKTFLHPSDDPSELAEEEAPNTLADGETADVQAGTRTYRIKRTGDTYYCNCIGWKTQNKAVDKKSCRHLKEYLGEEIECKRVGASMPVENKGGEATIFRSPKHKQVSVLLAQKYTESVNPTGWWISEKLDGVRAYWDGKAFYSRLGNEFIPPPWFIENYPSDMTLDGELFGGRKKFQSTVSIVKNAGSARWKELEYHIFDCPSDPNGFEGRIKALKDYFEKNKSKTAVVVEHTKCTGRAQITQELKKVENLGGEGLMIREPGSKYEKRRSNTLLKIKTFYDAEAVVIGHERGKGRNSNVTGALRCRMECGKEFSVGSGLSDKDRRSPPKVGSIITYKFQEYTNSGSPRFPTFIGIRIDMDAPKDAVLPAGKLQDTDV